MDNAADKPNRVDHHIWSVVRQQFWRQFAHAVAADIVLKRHRSVEFGGAKYKRILHGCIRGDVGLRCIRVYRRSVASGRHRKLLAAKLLADGALHHNTDVLLRAIYGGRG